MIFPIFDNNLLSRVREQDPLFIINQKYKLKKCLARNLNPSRIQALEIFLMGFFQIWFIGEVL